MINTHNSEVLAKNIVKIRLKNRGERRKLVGKLNNLNIKIKEKTLKFSFTSLNIKDEVKP